MNRENESKSSQQKRDRERPIDDELIDILLSVKVDKTSPGFDQKAADLLAALEKESIQDDPQKESAENNRKIIYWATTVMALAAAVIFAFIFVSSENKWNLNKQDTLVADVDQMVMASADEFIFEELLDLDETLQKSELFVDEDIRDTTDFLLLADDW